MALPHSRQIISRIRCLKPEKETISFVEVGVLGGRNSASILHHCPRVKATIVDRWSEYPLGDSYRGSEARLPYFRNGEWRGVFKEMVRNLSPYWGRFKIIQMDAIEAAPVIPDESQDLVFIDSDHSYEGVKNHVGVWWPKVSSGGWLSGHDYSWDGVKKAVAEFAENNNVDFEKSLGDTWWIKKQ